MLLGDGDGPAPAGLFRVTRLTLSERAATSRFKLKEPVNVGQAGEQVATTSDAVDRQFPLRPELKHV